MRQIDATFLVHHWDTNNKSLKNVINHEDSISVDESTLATWFKYIGYDKYKCLEFTFRAPNTIGVYKFRGIVFKWSAQYGHYVKIDKINYEKVFTAGWIINIHSQLYNRDAIKDWVDLHDFDGKLHDKSNVYARTVYQNVPNHNKSVQAEVMVIDGAVSHRDELFHLLTNIQWKGVYHNVGFIPFKINDVFTAAHVFNSIEAHNSQTKSLVAKAIKILQYDKVIKYVNSTNETTFAKWLSNCKIHQDNLFVTDETSAPHYVRMIYHKSNHSHVISVVNNLRKTFEKLFGPSTADDILGNGFAYSASMPATSKEASYFSSLANTYAAKLSSSTYLLSMVLITLGLDICSAL